MKKHHAHIGNITVSSNYPYVVYGSVRGLVSEHRFLETAQKSLREDERGCQKHHGYSDAHVYEWDPVSQSWERTKNGLKRDRAEALKEKQERELYELEAAREKGFNSYKEYLWGLS